MTASEATELAATLHATGNGHTLRAVVNGEWITFTGGSDGVHSIAFAVSSPARVLAHWAGYAANSGVFLPPPRPARQLDAEIAQALQQPEQSLESRPSAARPMFIEEMPRRGPVVGSRVVFESGSAASGRRPGVVSKVTKTRVLVDYAFKHGGAAQKWVRIADLINVMPPRKT